jgi:MerR family transcriptional regulator, light-induced transcriptional regulator
MLQHGFEKTILQVMFPFMRKIGIMWQVGSILPAQEHFVSNLVRQKIIVAIDGQEFVLKPSSKTVLLYLPEGELHELSLLFTHYKLKAHHHKVIYLGQSVPFNDLRSVVETAKPDIIFSVFTTAPREAELPDYVNALRAQFPGQTIALAGLQVNNAKLLSQDGLHVFNDLETTFQFIERLGDEARPTVQRHPGLN